MAIEPLVTGQAAVLARIVATLTERLTALWRPFTGWYDDAQVDQVVADSVHLVELAQAEARRQTTAYHRQVYREMGLTFPKLREADQVYPRREVTPEEVWSRPAVQYRFAVSKGAAPQEALGQALSRIEIMAEKEVQLAQRDQTADIYQGTPGRADPPDPDETAEPVEPVKPSKKKTKKKPKGVLIGYRRIVHPELAKDGMSCGLCVVAASRVYKTDELMPLHDGCNCTTLPVTNRDDPGKDLNAKDLEQLYKAAGSTGRKDLSAIRVGEYVSGELGPILTRAGKRVRKGETRDRLAPREKANAVSGDEAKRRSEPLSKDERVRELRALIDMRQKALDRLFDNEANKFRRKMLQRHIDDFKKKLDRVLKEAA